jgi:hypothetical protein
LRGRTVYNVGRSGYVGASYLDSLAPSNGVARFQ